jgi:hypothetical protein
VATGLLADYDQLVIEGASSPAAVNLRRSDLFKPEYQIQALQVVPKRPKQPAAPTPRLTKA